MKLLEVVAVLQDFPDGNVARGQVGTIVDELDKDNVLVEFADIDGVAYAISAIPRGMLMKLEHTPSLA